MLTSKCVWLLAITGLVGIGILTVRAEASASTDDKTADQRTSPQLAGNSPQVEELRQLAGAGDKNAQLQLVALYAEGRISVSEDADLSSPESTLAGYIDSLRSARASGVLERFEGRGFYADEPVPIEDYEVIEKIVYSQKEVDEWQAVPPAMPGDVELQVNQTEGELQYTTSYWLRNIEGSWKIYTLARWDLGEGIDEESDSVPPDAVAAAPDEEGRNEVPFTTAEKEIARLYRDLQAALSARGFDVGPPIVSIKPNRIFTASFGKFSEDNALSGIVEVAEALDVPLYTACFWLDDQLKCPLECSASAVLSSNGGLMSVQGYAVDCPGYETTIFSLP